MKIILLALFIITAATAQAQSATIGIGYTTKGFGMDAGYIHSSGIQLTAGYSVSVATTTSPNYTFLNAGYRLNITPRLSFTPTAGVSKYTVTVIQKTDNVIKSGFKPIYGLEVGKEAEYGSIFLSAGYCTVAYFGVGLRAFIK